MVPVAGHSDSLRIRRINHAMRLHVDLDRLDQTCRLAALLARFSVPGTIIALDGELGAGKTTFIRAFCSELGIPAEQVTSPTFVLIHEYEGSIPVYHFDAYRLRDSDEFLDLGVDEYLYGNGICLIEWAQRVADVLPVDRVSIRISIRSDHERGFEIHGGGREFEQLLNHVIDAWPADLPTAQRLN